MVLKKRCKA